MRKTARFLRRWRSDEGGGATVDYVVLTGGVALMGIAVVWMVIDAGVSATVQKASTGLKSASLASAGPVDAGAEEAAPDAETGQQGDATPPEVEEPAAAASVESEAPDDEETGKSNNGKSDVAHDNVGKHLAKGAAK